MKSNSKQTVSLSEDKNNVSDRNISQHAAFIASEEHSRARLRESESKIDRLRAAQFRLSDTISQLERKFQDDNTAAIKESQAKADIALKNATDTIHEKVENLSGKLDEKVKTLGVDLDRKVLEARNKIIEPLAIFVGLFTFISIGFQIFTQVKEYILWMPLLGAVLGGIIIFSGLIIHASSMNSDAAERRKYTALIIAIGLAIFVSAGIYYNEAIGILRTKDSKNCLIVKANDADTSENLYCKLSR